MSQVQNLQNQLQQLIVQRYEIDRNIEALKNILAGVQLAKQEAEPAPSEPDQQPDLELVED